MARKINEIYIWINKVSISEVLSEREDKFDFETGGILLGYRNFDENTEHWVVTKVAGPGIKAVHGNYRYTPDYEHHDYEATKHFEDTNGREYYLGDWHTHPSSSAHTSWLDKLTILRNAKRANHTDRRTLMLIIGGQLELPEFMLHLGASNERYLGLVAKPLIIPFSSNTPEWMKFSCSLVSTADTSLIP